MHLKRYPAPNRWKIERKSEPWVPSPKPGPHSGEESVPLVVALRDMLGIADTSREVKRIATEGNVKVDGVTRRDEQFPVGLFDSLQVGDRSYRMLLDRKDRFSLKEVEDADKKLVKVEDATNVAGGDRQMHLSDGTNLIGDEPTRSTVLLSLPEKEKESCIEMKEGNLAFVTGGKHAGQLAEIIEFEVVLGSSPNRVVLESNGDQFGTTEDYVFVVGEEEPEVEV